MGVPTRPADTRQTYPDPTAPLAEVNRNAVYQQLFAYYSNTAFEDVAAWARYRLRHSLYRYTRPIFNPITRVVDFYAEHIYPGILTPENLSKSGRPSAIPFSADTAPEIRAGAGQLWQWSNWQVNNPIMVQHGALTGNVLVEVIDDVESGKIRFQTIFPSNVADFRLDDYGNLKAYVLEYQVSDPNIDGGRSFTYAKEVQPEFIAYYKNGQPHDYGRGAVTPGYGFVPAVWVKHLDIGMDYGVAAIRSSLGKIDELNSIMSHVADHIHKQINSPRILWTNSNVTPLFSNQTADTTDFDTRQDQVLLKGAQGGTTETLVGDLDPQTIVPHFEKLYAEIERDYPEITMYEKLRDQNIVTAPGASRLMGDVERKISRPAANYDLANTKLIQMGLAIGGFRANSGDWGILTPQQKKFAPFNLDSYNKGQLELTILERELTPQTSREQADELAVRANAISALGDNIPLEEKLRILGKREDEIPAIVAAIEKERDAAAKRATEMALASKPAATDKGDDKE
jgi:hypothetical protein